MQAGKLSIHKKRGTCKGLTYMSDESSSSDFDISDEDDEEQKDD